MDNFPMAITLEGLIDLPDLRIPGRNLVERIYKGAAGMFPRATEGEKVPPVVTKRFSPLAEDQINATRAMFNELDEVIAGRSPSKRFIIQ